MLLEFEPKLINKNIPKLHRCLLHLQSIVIYKQTHTDQGQITINLRRQVQANWTMKVSCLFA